MLILRNPWTAQPQYPAAIRKDLAATLVYSGGSGRVNLASSLVMTTRNSPTTGYGPAEVALSLSSSTDMGLLLDDSFSKTFPSTTDCTIAVRFRHRDTTARASALFGGLDITGATDPRVLVHFPWSDGNIYWDFGTITSGRLSSVYTKTTSWRNVVLVAGGGKGREIWIDGTRVANNTGITGTLGAVSNRFAIGYTSGATTASDNVDLSLFVVSQIAWSDAKIKAWSANPWSATFAPRNIVVAVGVGAAATFNPAWARGSTSIVGSGLPGG